MWKYLIATAGIVMSCNAFSAVSHCPPGQKVTLECALKDDKAYRASNPNTSNAEIIQMWNNNVRINESPKSKTIKYTGSSSTQCTVVPIPPGTSVGSHEIWISGTYVTQRNAEQNWVKGINQRIYYNSGITLCAPQYGGYYSFSYTVTAVKS